MPRVPTTKVIPLPHRSNRGPVDTADPSFILSNRHPLYPEVLRNPGLVDVVHRVSGRPRVAPGVGWPPLTAGVPLLPK